MGKEHGNTNQACLLYINKEQRRQTTGCFPSWTKFRWHAVIVYTSGQTQLTLLHGGIDQILGIHQRYISYSVRSEASIELLLVTSSLSSSRGQVFSVWPSWPTPVRIRPHPHCLLGKSDQEVNKRMQTATAYAIYFFLLPRVSRQPVSLWTMPMGDNCEKQCVHSLQLLVTNWSAHIESFLTLVTNHNGFIWTQTNQHLLIILTT